VFSDKTGTLTQNLMEFKKCFIGGKTYGDTWDEDLEKNDNVYKSSLSSNPNKFNINGDTSAYKILRDEEEEIGNSSCNFNNSEKKNIKDFFMVTCVCHSAISEKEKNGDLKYSCFTKWSKANGVYILN
jgi:P-type E1-E2 ATPase